jgi:hypothetical protein
VAIMRFGHHSFLREALIRESEAESLLRHRRRGPRRTGAKRKVRRAAAQPTFASYVLLFAILLALAIWLG